MAHHDTEHHHTEDDGDGGYDGRGAHLKNLLEREIQSQREQQEHHTDIGPQVYVGHINSRWRIGHVRTNQETCHDVAQHKGLL